MSRRQYLRQNFHTYLLVWISVTISWACLFVMYANFDDRSRFDLGMVVISPIVAFSFLLLAFFTLSSLGKTLDEQFMPHAIFWCGSTACGLVTIALRTSLGPPIAILGQSFLIALVLGTVVFYLTGTRAEFKQKTLE